MENRRKKVMTMMLAVSLLFGVVILQGCGNNSETVKTCKMKSKQSCGAIAKKDCKAKRSCGVIAKKDCKAKQSCGVIAKKDCKAKRSCDFKVAKQTICPVMGGKINQSIYTEYQGQKVYFCCGGCISKFEKEPEKYASNLSNVSSIE